VRISTAQITQGAGKVRSVWQRHKWVRIVGYGLIAMGFYGAGQESAAPPEGGTQPQSSFPCEEDEVLGYDPVFGPDKVGCIHIEALKR
jgi:hypothetical protein